MKSPDHQFASVLDNRRGFLDSHDISTEATTLVYLTYGGEDYCRYTTVNNHDLGDGIVRPPTQEADALVVTQPGHALFLPLADCVAAVIYDATAGVLMVSHLGRHNLEQFGGTKCVEYLSTTHGSDPKSLDVWLSPAATKATYPLYTFEGRGLHEVAREQLTKAGVASERITASPIDSAQDTRYFSHSQFLKGNRDTDGRFAVVAMMTDD